MDVVIHGEKDGIQTAAQIRAKRNVPLIFLTAYSQKGVVDRAKELAPLDYVVKPFEEKVLVKILEQAAITISSSNGRLSATS